LFFMEAALINILLRLDIAKRQEREKLQATPAVIEAI